MAPVQIKIKVCPVQTWTHTTASEETGMSEGTDDTQVTYLILNEDS